MAAPPLGTDEADARLIQVLSESLRALAPPARLLVAYSGGLDSTVLLHALHRAGAPRLYALHVQHGLQDAAREWPAHCERACAALGVELQVIEVEVQTHGQGIEAAAREARYAALSAQMQMGDVLVTAHHQDDQAETLLLRLLRGSGIAGLAAMAALKSFGAGQLWRPLLRVPRAQLLAYAQSHRLNWVEDPHNHDPRFARSLLRAEIMPRLRTHWPAASATLARSATLVAEHLELLDELALADLAVLRRDAASLSISALLALSAPRRRNALRAWLRKLDLPEAFHETLQRLDAEVLAARADASPLLAWPGGEFRRYRDALYAMPRLPALPEVFALYIGASGLAPQLVGLPPGCGLLGWTLQPPLRVDLRLRMLREADRFQPAGSPRARSLKTLFQQHGVPPWVRRRTPVLVHGTELLWLGGFGWNAAHATRPPLHWVDAPPGAMPGGLSP